MSDAVTSSRKELPLRDQILGPIRILVGTVLMTIYTAVFFAICLVFLPSRPMRIKACNYYGRVAGSTVMWLSGCPLTFVNRHEFRADRPAIYVSNHTSIVDLFLGMWISPVGTVGVAKKQVAWYPLLGQLYLLSGHLRIDRGNSAAAVESLKQLAALVRDYNLSIWMWPEGTRSRDGRLLPFKKGALHLALQTRLPIVPVVVAGAHRAWVKNSMIVQQVPITITCLPAIDTANWEPERIDEYVEQLHAAFAAALPEEQRPGSQLAA